MNDIVKDFIRQNINLIDQNNFEQLYTKATQRDVYANVGELTQVLISSGINPLEHMTRVPERFLSDSDVKEFQIPDNVTRIDGAAFSGCKLLGSITIPNSVTSVGQYAFGGCNALNNVLIPDSVTSIEPYAFSYCTSLKNITISNGVKLIDRDTFCGCHSLIRVVIPDSVKKIDSCAFEFCVALKSVTIGNGINIIGDRVFDRCDSLKTLKYRGTKVEWNKIEKDSNWNRGEHIKVVHCTDGDIKI